MGYTACINGTPSHFMSIWTYLIDSKATEMNYSCRAFLWHYPMLEHLGNESRNKSICCLYRFPKFKILLLLCFKSAISEHPAPGWKVQATSTSDPTFPNLHLWPNYKPLDAGVYEETTGTPLANTIKPTAAALTRTAEVEVIPILFAIQPHTVTMLVLSEM